MRIIVRRYNAPTRLVSPAVATLGGMLAAIAILYALLVLVFSL